jgi:hypothetical protein
MVHSPLYDCWISLHLPTFGQLVLILVALYLSEHYSLDLFIVLVKTPFDRHSHDAHFHGQPKKMKPKSTLYKRQEHF